MNCDSTCKTCSGPQENECITCDPGVYFHSNSCVTACPDGYYPNETDIKCYGKMTNFLSELIH